MYLTFYGLVCGCVGVSGGKGTVRGVACFLFFFHSFFPFARWDGWGGNAKVDFDTLFSTGIVLFLLFWFRYDGWMEDRVWVEVRWSGD